MVDNLVAEAGDITYVADGNNRRREPGSLKLSEDGTHSYLREPLLRFRATAAAQQQNHEANDAGSTSDCGAFLHRTKPGARGGT